MSNGVNPRCPPFSMAWGIEIVEVSTHISHPTECLWQRYQINHQTKQQEKKSLGQVKDHGNQSSSEHMALKRRLQ